MSLDFAPELRQVNFDILFELVEAFQFPIIR